MGRLIWVLLLAAFHVGGARAQQDVSLPQLNHREFTVDQGAPGASFAIAQTTDGTLWMGSTQGLFRFDGARFVRHPDPEEWPISSANVWSLFATRDGGLWAGYRFGGASHLKDGVLTNYGEAEGLPSGAVLRFELERSGTLWIATQGGLARLVGSRWEQDAGAAGLKTIVGFLIDRRGTQWIATPDGLLLRRAGEARFREADKRRFFPFARAGLAEAPDGKVWASTQDGLIRVDDRGEARQPTVIAVRGYEGRTLRPLMFDREGNLWAAPLGGGGVLRVPARELARNSTDTLDSEFFASAGRLSSRSVFALLEDREGNFWASSAEGISRFSRGNVVRDLHLCPAPAAMAAAEHGGIWIGCRAESATWLFRDGSPDMRLPTSPFTAAYRDHDGGTWFAGPASLGQLRDGRIDEVALPPEVSGGPVQALLRDREGGIWLSAPLRGVFRLSGGVWSRNGGLEGLPPDPATSAVVQPDGTVWLGYRGSRVARIRDRQVKFFGTAQGLDIGTVLALTARGDELWVGGERGIAVFGNGRFSMIRNAAGTSFSGVSGVIATRSGDLWLNGTHGISRIANAEIAGMAQRGSTSVKAVTFDYRDGVPGVAIVYDTLPSAIEGTDGRIWFATTAGLVSINAQALVRNVVPPPVTIWSVSTDHQRYGVGREEIRLPLGLTRLKIGYSAGTLTVPERVQFRYRLEGLETDWQNGGNSREATYTNLGPGRYRFQVIAANQDGVWNEEGASVAFTIPPAWYQTTWFIALCWLAACALLFALYRLRVQRVSAQIIGRLEARMAERERIARELHDTLLQTFQGLVLRLQTALQLWPSPDARGILSDGIDQAADAITEGRNAVQGLRYATDSGDLEGAIRSLGQVLAGDPGAAAPRFGVEVQGRPRALRPIVRDEIFRIAGEAMRNAFRHAEPRRVEVDIRYGDRELSVLVRDDGKGMDPSLTRRGREGHFGLNGMRERAKLIGGRLTFRTRRDAGTEIQLVVSAARTYAAASASKSSDGKAEEVD